MLSCPWPRCRRHGPGSWDRSAISARATAVPATRTPDLGRTPGPEAPGALRCHADTRIEKGPAMSNTGEHEPTPGAREPGWASSSDPAAAERAVRALRAAGRLAEAADLVDQLGPYGVADAGDATMSLGAAVLEAYADQLAAAAPCPAASRSPSRGSRTADHAALR